MFYNFTKWEAGSKGIVFLRGIAYQGLRMEVYATHLKGCRVEKAAEEPD